MKNYLKQLFKRIEKHHIGSFSAQIAYYMLLSLFPFLILLFMFLTELSISYEDQMTTIYRVVPEAVGEIIRDYLSYSKQFSNAIFSPLLFTSLWLSSNATMGMMDALNMAYDQDDSRSYFKKKILAVMTTLLTLVLIISALILPNIGIYVVGFLRKIVYIPEIPELLFNLIKFLLASGIFFTILATLYFVLPNCKLKVKEILPGTGFSFVGLLIISYLFGYFVKEFSRYSLVYGGLAAVIILMMWLYLCGHIIMIGGEINAMKTQKYKNDKSFVPKANKEKSKVKPSLFFRRKD